MAGNERQKGEGEYVLEFQKSWGVDERSVTGIEINRGGLGVVDSG